MYRILFINTNNIATFVKARKIFNVAVVDLRKELYKNINKAKYIFIIYLLINLCLYERHSFLLKAFEAIVVTLSDTSVEFCPEYFSKGCCER